MAEKNLRRLQQSNRQQIESELVLSRMGELDLRNLDIMVRGLLYPVLTKDAVILEGLTSSPGAGLSVDLTNPAVCMQGLGDGNLHYVLDDNGDNVFNVTLDAADPTDPRIDIIEARIETRSTFTDNAVNVVDPTTKIVSPVTLDRDFERFLSVRKKTGTAAPSPSAPSPTAATAGQIDGTVTIATTIDLSTEYIISIAIGPDSEYVEVDCRGATPGSTTLTEIINALNAAGFGTIASNNGSDQLRITAPGTGENSVVKFKAPLSAATDALNEIMGLTESAGYVYTFAGENGYFKVAEVFVPNGAATLSASDVRSREEKDTQWNADAATIENGYSLDAHRKASELDHPDDSVFLKHLAQEVIDAINQADVQQAIADQAARNDIQDEMLLDHELRLAYLDGKQSQTSSLYVDTHTQNSLRDQSEKASGLPIKQVSGPAPNKFVQKSFSESAKDSYIKPRELPFRYQQVTDYPLKPLSNNVAGSGRGVTYDSVRDCFWILVAPVSGTGQVVNLYRVSNKFLDTGHVDVIFMWTFAAITGESFTDANFFIDSTKSYLLISTADGSNANGRITKLFINNDGDLIGRENGSTFAPGQVIDITDPSNHEIEVSSVDGPMAACDWDTSNILLVEYPGRFVWRRKSDLTLSAVPLTIPTQNGNDDITDVNLTMDATNILDYLVGVIREPGTNKIYVIAATEAGALSIVPTVSRIVQIDFDNDVVISSGTPQLVSFSNVSQVYDVATGLTLSKSGDLLIMQIDGLYLTRYALAGNPDMLPGTIKYMLPIASPHVAHDTSGTGVCRAFAVDSNGNYWFADFGQAANDVDLGYYSKDGTKSSGTTKLTGLGWTGIVGMVFVAGRGASDPGTTGSTEWLFMIGFDGGTNYLYGIPRADVEAAFGGNLDLSSAPNALQSNGFVSSSMTDITFDGTDLFILSVANDALEKITLDGTTWGTNDVRSVEYILQNSTAAVVYDGVAFKNNRFYFITSGSIQPTRKKIIRVLDTDRSDATNVFMPLVMYINLDRFTQTAQSDTYFAIDFEGDDLVYLIPELARDYARVIKVQTFESTHRAPILGYYSFHEGGFVPNETFPILAQTSAIKKRQHSLTEFTDARNRLGRFNVVCGGSNDVTADNATMSLLILDRYLLSRNPRDIKFRHFLATDDLAPTSNPVRLLNNAETSTVMRFNGLELINDMVFIAKSGGGAVASRVGAYQSINFVKGPANSYMHDSSLLHVDDLSSLNRRNDLITGRFKTISNPNIQLAGYYNLGGISAVVLNNDDTNNQDKLFVAISSTNGALLFQYSIEGKPLQVFENVFNNTNVGNQLTAEFEGPYVHIARSGFLFGISQTNVTGLFAVASLGKPVSVARITSDAVGSIVATANMTDPRAIGQRSITYKTGQGWRHLIPIAFEQGGFPAFALYDFENNSYEIAYGVLTANFFPRAVDVFDEQILTLWQDSVGQTTFQSLALEKYRGNGLPGTTGTSQQWHRQGPSARLTGHTYGHNSANGGIGDGVYTDPLPSGWDARNLRTSDDINVIAAALDIGLVLEHYDNANESEYYNEPVELDSSEEQPVAYQYQDTVLAEDQYLPDYVPVSSATEQNGSSENWFDQAAQPFVSEDMRVINEDGTTEGYLTYSFSGATEIALLTLFTPEAGVIDVWLRNTTDGVDVIGINGGATTFKIDTFRAGAITAANVAGDPDVIPIAEGLDPAKTYEIKVGHASSADKTETGEFTNTADGYSATYTGGHNDAASGSDYPIYVEGFWVYKKYTAEVKPEVILTDDDFPADEVTLELQRKQSLTYFTLQQTYNGDNVNDEFTLSGTNHAYRLHRYSRDGGTTWLDRDDVTISWGSNAPNYDDETVNASKQFTVKDLAGPPPVGVNNVIIEFIPSFSKYTLKDTIIAHKNGSDYYRNGNIKRTDKALELVRDGVV